MPKPRHDKSEPERAADHAPGESSGSFPRWPAAELLSFLKEIRAAQPWSEKDLSMALKIGLPQAKEATVVLQLQGYIEPAGRTGKWRITEQGELVSGARSPRFNCQSVKDALAALRDRIKAVNADREAAYKVADAVAFGDFLRDQPRVQAAEVGIRLARRAGGEFAGSAREHAAERHFLKELRGRTAMLRLELFEDWMSARSHLSLL
jgi:hypothetical protein